MNRQPLRGNDIREYNEKLVLKIIHNNKVISQSEVTKIIGLKAPTVLRIFTKLEADGYIHICSHEKNVTGKKGRKPVFYRANPGIFNSIGIDFWSESASIVVSDFCGNIIFKKIHNFEKHITAQEVITTLKRLISEAISKSGENREKFLGIGIGAPGRVDITNGSIISYARIKGMHDFPIKEHLESSLKIPVFVHNNSSVIALSEYRYGIAKNINSLLLVLIRSGVGGALIDQGKIFTSQNRTALEIGHMSIDINGKVCPCGRKGCLEAYISEDQILAKIQKQYPAITIDSISDDFVDDNFKKIIEEQAYYLIEGLKNLYQIFTPRSFLIITRSAVISKILRDFIIKQFLNSDDLKDSNISILSDVYDPILAGLGATDLVFDNFFR